MSEAFETALKKISVSTLRLQYQPLTYDAVPQESSIMLVFSPSSLVSVQEIQNSEHGKSYQIDGLPPSTYCVPPKANSIFFFKDNPLTPVFVIMTAQELIKVVSKDFVGVGKDIDAGQLEKNEAYSIQLGRELYGWFEGICQPNSDFRILQIAKPITVLHSQPSATRPDMPQNQNAARLHPKLGR